MTIQRKSIKQKNKNINENDAKYMDVTEVANLLKMSTSHIYTMTSQKKIPHIKLLGRKVLFDREEITNWLKQKSVAVK